MTCAVDIPNNGSPCKTDCNNEKPTVYCCLRAFLLLCGAILALVFLHGPYTESLYGGPVQKIGEIIKICSTNGSTTYTKATRHIFEGFLREFYEDENLTEEMKKGEVAVEMWVSAQQALDACISRHQTEQSLINEKVANNLQKFNLTLLILGGLSTLFSVVYYVRFKRLPKIFGG